MAWVLKAKNAFMNKPQETTLTFNEMKLDENWIIKFIQQQYFSAEIECISKNISLPRSSSINRLCPFLDKNGVMRVHGRLGNLWYL